MEGVGAVQQLYKIVEDAELCNVYEEFLVNHFAWENFGFWFEVEMFKKEEDPAEQKKMASLIYSKFLEEGSIFELGDLDPGTRKIIANRLEDPPATLFNGLQKKVMNCLALATISDFLNDNMYLAFQTSRSPKSVNRKLQLKKEQEHKKILEKPLASVDIKKEFQADLINTNTCAKGFLFNFHEQVYFVGHLGKMFTLGQFNILARDLASSSHFPYVAKDKLTWEQRKHRLVANMVEMRTKDGVVDIICLEELSEYWEFFKDTLGSKEYGYNSVYCKRPSITVSSWSGKIKTDGCGIFYSSKKFSLVHHHSVNFSDSHDRVALVLLLRFIAEQEGPQYVVVANTHLYWDITRVDDQIEELKQVKIAIGELLEYAEKENGLNVEKIPVVLAGDFNNVPSSKVYEYIMNEFSPLMRSAYANYSQCDQEGVPPKLSVSEIPTSGEFEPSTTSVTYKRSRTIDYIFYSPSLLELTSLQVLPSEEELRNEPGDLNWQDSVNETFEEGKNYNGIPNSKWGSDHLPICATFSLK